MKLRK